jgi:hypothetical protein
VNSLIGIVGILLGCFFYFNGKQYRELTFSVNPVKLEIVSANQASRLSVDFNGKPIKSDITTAQVALWNRGNLPIAGSDILTKQVIISTDPKTPILEASLKKIGRDVTPLFLNLNELQEGRILVNWEMLEKGDGGVVEVIYAGPPDVKFNVEGAIVGQKEIERYNNQIGFRSPYEEYEALRRSNKGAHIISIPFAILAAIGFIFNIREIVKGETYTASYQRVASIILAALLVLMIGLSICMFIFSRYPNPPLGL